MARIQPTKVEELDRDKPGLRLLVDLNLDAFRTLESIQEAVEQKHGVRIPLSTLSSYKQRRWLAQKQRVESIKEHAAAILDVLDKHGVGEVRQALLFERVQKAMDSGAELDPHFLLKEERLWAEQALKREQLDQEKKKLELQIQRMKNETEEALDEAKQKASRGESLSVADINRIRERVFGLPEIAAGPAD